MKKYRVYSLAILFVLSCITLTLSAQVGINSTSIGPASSAMLDISSTDKGLLIPRISTEARNLIPSPATGLLIYNTSTNHFNYYNGNFWYEIESSFVSATIGTNSPGGGFAISSSADKVADNSAMLDVSDPTRGFLPARTTQGAVSLPANGLIIYDTDANILKYYFDNVWYPVCGISTGTPGASGSQNSVGVGINTTGASPHPSAILDVASQNKGVLIPRLTNSERDAILPVSGLTIFNTTSRSIEFFNGTEWLKMNLILQAGVAISSSAVTVCAETAVSYTATPVNGGLSPAYQWKVNGSNVPGATSSTYAYVPAHNDVVTCQMTSSSPCAVGNPATSNLITMTVNPLLPVSISVVPSNNPVCAGTSVTYGANIVNGGASPVYQWRLNGTNITGATNPTYTYIPVTGNAISCILTSNALCATGTPAASNVVNMIVNPLLPVSLSVAPSANPVCAGTGVTFTATPVNAGPSPAYQWKLNGANVTGATNITYTFVPANTNSITCVLTSTAICATGTPATSNSVSMVVNPLLPVSISVAPTANPVCDGTGVTFTATPVNAGPSPAYQWKLNGTDIAGATNTTYSYTPANGNAISCVLTSNAICATGNPAASNVVNMTVHPLLPVSISIAALANPVCAGTSVTYTSNIVNGGATPAYQWKLNGSNIAGATNATYSFIPADANSLSCILTSNATCATGTPATSNNVVMTVHPLLPVSISIAPSANPVCAGTSVTYTSNIVNGGASPQYQWKLNGTPIAGATNTTYTYTPSHGNALTCVLTSNATCATGTPATSNTVNMTVNPLLPVSISTFPTANPVCAGTSVTFTSNIVNGGNTPLYQWKLNGTDIAGATNAAYTYVPVNSDGLSCVLTSNATCATGTPALSNVVSMTVNPLLPVNVSISPSDNPVCAGTNVLFTSNRTNGGQSPQFQWKLNGVNIAGATNSSYDTVPLDNQAISVVLTSNATCATGNPALSNTVMMTVNPLLPVSISIAPSNNPVCAGTVVTYTSSIVHGGPSPLYQWQLNGNDISGATDASYAYTPLNGNVISCVLTSNAICAVGTPATSNSITMTVHPLLPVSIAIVPSANPVCAGTSVTFTATPTNGGSSPQYQWKLNGNDFSGATDATFTTTPVNADAVSCVVTSNATCPTGTPATSNTVTMTVNPLLPVSVQVTPSANPVCAGTSVTYTAIPVNGGPIPGYQWKLDGQDIAGATNETYTYVPADGAALSCVLTSSAICPIGTPATSNVVTMTVHPLLPVSITITSSVNSVCAGTTATFSSAIVNGGATPMYQWKLNGTDIPGATNAAYTYVPANTDAITCVLTSNATCAIGTPATSNVVTMIIHPLLPVSLTITPSANSVCPGTSVTVTASIVNGGSAPAYQWSLNLLNIPGATTSSYTFTPANGDVVHCILTSNALCATGTPATSNTLTMIVLPFLPVGVTISSSAVVAGSPVTFTATPVNGGTAPAYQWKVNGVVAGTNSNSYTYTPATNDKVTTTLTSSASCAIGSPATSNTVIITGTNPVPVSVTISASGNSVCAGTNITFTAATLNCGTSPAYQWKVNGTNVTGATNATYAFVPLNSNALTCVVTPTGGTAVTSNTITMSVIPLVPVSATITASLYAVMPGTQVTFTATPVNQGIAPGYQWKVNGAVVATNTLVYTYTPANHDLVSFVLTSSSAVSCLTNNPATSNVITMVVYMTGTPCSSAPTVTYGGLTYNTVQIGTQCWLRENINIGNRINGTVEQLPNSITEKYCYDNKEMNCNVYGGMYQWAEAVQYLNGASNTTNWNPVPTTNVQGICPPGWHIPSNTEWGTLMTSQGGSAVAGGKLKEDGLYHFFVTNLGGTNTSGFTSLPTGQRWTTGAFNYINKSVQYWTTTTGASSSDAWYGGTSYATATATNGQFVKATGVAVRCLKD